MRLQVTSVLKLNSSQKVHTSVAVIRISYGTTLETDFYIEFFVYFFYIKAPVPILFDVVGLDSSLHSNKFFKSCSEGFERMRVKSEYKSFEVFYVSAV